YGIMVCTIPASAWTWLVRPRKASAVTMNGAGLDAGEGNLGSVIILQSGWESARLSEPPSLAEGGQVPGGARHPSSQTDVLATWALLLAPKCWCQIWCLPSGSVSPPCLLSKHCWFRPVCASSPAVVSERSWGSGIGRNLGVRLGKSAAGVVERGSEGASTSQVNR
ncbi:hypothetical protein GW17_00034479, partial [Ensete ventricosum]